MVLKTLQKVFVFANNALKSGVDPIANIGAGRKLMVDLGPWHIENHLMAFLYKQ